MVAALTEPNRVARELFAQIAEIEARPGDAVLDVATGTGAVALAAALVTMRLA